MLPNVMYNPGCGLGDGLGLGEGLSESEGLGEGDTAVPGAWKVAVREKYPLLL